MTSKSKKQDSKKGKIDDMKKFFQFALMAAFAFTMAACGSKSSLSPEEEKAAKELAETGTVYEGAHFTLTYPGAWKETFKNEGTINATADDNYTKIDATFSDYPCKPADFEQYYKNFTGMSMHSSFKFDPMVVDGNILTFKGVNGDFAMTTFVVYIDDKAGVGGSVKYPVAKAAEVEPLIKPMLQTIKKK